MGDILVRNACLAAGYKSDILIKDGVIVDIDPVIGGLPDNFPVIDAMGYLVTAPFVDSHFHLDATLSYGLPRINQSGTLLEGIKIWGELKPQLTFDALVQRAITLCRWSIARGTLAVRSHVDVSDPSLLAVEAMLDVKRQMAPYMDIQLVAFPQDGFLRANCMDNLRRALDLGLDVVGGIPHFERTMNDGTKSVEVLCKLAADRGLLVDMHCDESDDPLSRHVESLVQQTTRLGMQGRVAGSHLTSMHSMDNYYVSKLLPLMREADVHVIANPLINITLQGRHDTYPKRRGMTRVFEQISSGLTVAFGHDCVMDPWYPLGSHDMLEVANMGLHVAQMTGPQQMQNCFEAVTCNPAKILHMNYYGLRKGCHGDLVILQATDVIDAIRLKPARIAVIRRGKVISTTQPVKYDLALGAEHVQTDLTSADLSWR